MTLIDSMKRFSSMLDGKLIIAGFGMIAIVLIIVTIIVISVNSFNKRKELIKVALPNIDDLSKHGKKIVKFNGINDLSIELVNSEEDNLENIENFVDKDEVTFLTTLALESKKFIPENSDDIKMPAVGNIDYEEIKNQKKVEIEIRNKEELIRIKELAEIDNQGVSVKIENEIINDLNNDNEKGVF